MNVTANRPVAAARPIAAARPAAPAAPAAPVMKTEAPRPVAAPKPVVKAAEQPWTVGRVAKAAGAGVAGFVGGTGATVVADLFFHFGNNGGTAWPGGIYLMAAGAVAVGAMALYAKLSAK